MMLRTTFALLASVLWLGACDRPVEPPPHHGSGGYIWGSGGFIGGTGGFIGGSGGAIGGTGGAVDACVGRGNTPITGITMDSTCSGYATQGGSYQGYWYTFSDAQDGGNSIICPYPNMDVAVPFTDGVCVVGVARKVVDNQYSTYWGAGFGWNVAQPKASECEAGPAGTVDLNGKQLRLVVDAPPGSFRVMLDLADLSQVCLDISGQATMDLPFASFVSECWPGGSQLPVTPQQLSAVRGIQFMVPTTPYADVPFNFCVTELHVQ